MNYLLSKHRLRSRMLATALAVILIVPVTVHAAEQDASFELHPHCTERDAEEDDWLFGPIPSPGIVVETRDGGVRCSTFEVKDPQTLQTPALAVGDILDIDLIINNPSEQEVKRIRAWLSYDPDMLEGELLEINDAYGLVTPDENDFSGGYAKMEASAENDIPSSKKIIFARMQFRVKKTNPIGTPISFHDVQPGGHSVIMAKEGDDEAYVVKEEPGVLLVRFIDESTDTEEPEPEEDIGNIFDTMPITPESPPKTETPAPPPPEPEQLTDPNACVRNEDCDAGKSCVAGECKEAKVTRANGESCIVDDECESGLCGSGICIPSLSDTTDATETETDTNEDRTAFSLLQIQNVRVTTEGSSIFLAWDHLRSSQLKAYNIYYGTTSGRYIQRRTIDKGENSITLRSLTPGTRYFLGVRGLSLQEEESAFSREVSIVVGDPDSSTAPLVAGSFTDSPSGNPVANILDNGLGTDVPGETGLSSNLLLALLACSIIGTAFASKRQLLLHNTKTDAE